MDRRRISIGRMAEINGVSIAALRHYDELGLLKPDYVDPKTGYRYYTINQNARLDMIAYMKELGMSLGEIGRVLEKEDISLIESILGKKSEQILEQIRELQERREAVERSIASIERYRKSPETGVVFLEFIEKRFLWSSPCRENFYEEGRDSYERELVEFRRRLMEAGIPQIHSYNVGTSIRAANIRKSRFLPDRILIFSDRSFAAYPGDVGSVESGMFACIYVEGFEEEIAGAEKLLRFCRDSGYRIDGDYYCEVMTEFNVFDSQSRQMFLRLQVPVKF